ncbi:MAG: methanogenesis marker protein 11, partial [Halobacteriota archaeon]
VEFAGLDDEKPINKFKKLLEELSLSDKTGMAVLKSFSAECLLDFGNATRSGEVSISTATEAANVAGVEVCLQGRGIIGAVAALPFFSQSDESVKLDKILYEKS